MSLKGFHLVFIFLAICVTVGFWAWAAFVAPSDRTTPDVVWMGRASGLMGLLLIPYGIWFVTKSRRIIT